MSHDHFLEVDQTLYSLLILANNELVSDRFKQLNLLIDSNNLTY